MTETQTPEAPEQQSVETEAVEVETTNEAEAVESQDQSEQQEQPKEEWPASAVNARKRDKKAINKYYAQWKSAEERVAELEAKLKESKPINADDYESIDEYWDAKSDAKVETKLTKAEIERQKATVSQHKQQMEAERLADIREQAAELTKVNPDLPQVWQQNAAALDSLPPEISEMFYSLDNAAAAIYTLGKEGKIANLAYMHPQIAAQEIWAAQQRGQAQPRQPQQPVSSAPQPMKGARGAATSTKNLMDGSVLKNLGLKS